MTNFLRPLVLLMSVSLAPLAHAETMVYFSPNGGCQQAVVTQINKAQKSIDIAMYSFTSREIAQALVAAKQRQVKVKIVLDIAQIKDLYSKSRYLMSKGFNVKFHMGPGLMHNKFAVIDDQVLLTGSFNWTITADKRNTENLLVITDKDLAQKFTKEFKHLWAQSGEAQLKDNS